LCLLGDLHCDVDLCVPIIVHAGAVGLAEMFPSVSHALFLSHSPILHWDEGDWGASWWGFCLRSVGG
jgi:hypothetical protein